MAAFLGILTPLAFSPYDIWPVSFLSPCLLLILINQQTSRHAFIIGLIWGVGFFGHGINWVHVSIDTFGGVPPFVSFLLVGLLSVYLSLYPALFSWALTRLFPSQTAAKFLFAAPAFWLISEWLRGWVFTGFPWLWLGYSQIDNLLANYAPVGGVELITFVVMMISGSFAYILLSRNWKWSVIPCCLLLIAWGLNQIQWVTPQPDRQTKIALIQGNIDQALKWLPGQRWPTIVKYTDLTRENWDADIIIWPEAAVPAFEHQLSDYFSALSSSAKSHHSAIITGVLNQTGKTYYNSILTLGEGTGSPDYELDASQRYHKHHLLPFGEFVPFEKLLRPLAPIFNLPMSSFADGAYIQPNLQAKDRYLVPALCYEIIFNEQVRANTTEKTDFILTLSNDAWFGHSIGPLQHMEIARMRALELGKPLIRSTNNGVTAITDYRGHIVKRLPQFETGVLKATLTSTKGITPYHRWGSWLIYALVTLSLLTSLYLRRKLLVT
ncbi:Apolipoprotein N-acyltransferase [Vibrio quintilis]|uniref:Apolipoprotein N-acyltransferase n=2 Tax=Vibrio quintilis TaxID=1117707 RepID=A0A1M7YZH0_9VIBR|nr:Apolipoprotein N-acyltransferase [Vibrio quintilis]